MALVEFYLRQDPLNQVVATARNPSKATELTALTKEFPGRVHVIALDVEDDASVKGFAEEATKTLERVDVLVNNAGVLAPARGELTEV